MNQTYEDMEYIKHYLKQPCPAFGRAGTCFCGHTSLHCPIGYIRQQLEVKVDRDFYVMTEEESHAFIHYVLAVFFNNYCVNPPYLSIGCSKCAFFKDHMHCIRHLAQNEYERAKHERR